ncbi:MAG: HAD-IA family hydrolase [Acholeplasmataceae bacterium]|jgi:phosphatidylglycerol:prolipoprotein diacylglycerol transferase
MIKGVLFDLDGTLIDSAPSILRCFDITFRDLFPEVTLTEEERLSFLGPTLVQTFSRYTDDMNYVQKAFDYYVKHSQVEHDNDLIGAFPNAAKTLKLLKDSGYKIGIVTSKKNNMARRGMANNDLLEYVDVLVGFDDIKHHKPRPDSLLKAAELLNLKVEELMYVGDHANDILAAQACNMISVGVEFSYNLDKIKLHNPDYIIKDLLELLDIVKEK